MQRLALRAAGRRPDPSFTAMVFLVLRHRPWTRAVPDESHLQDAASNLEAGSAERQVKARFAASF